MTWLLVSAHELSAGAVALEEREHHHHVARVLRGRVGDELTLFDGCGRLARGEIRSISKKVIEVVLQEPTSQPRLSGTLRVHLALLKSDRLDLCIQKLTEVGADEIHLFAAENSVAKWTGDRASDRLRRLQQIAAGAAAQSHRAYLPRILWHDDELASQAMDSDARIACVAQGSAPALMDRLATLETTARISIAIGPEGGFSPLERESLAATFSLASLGPAILRAETAAIVATTLASVRLGRMGCRQPAAL